MLQSKLKTTYTIADPAAHIIGDHTQLDPIFAGRLAQVAKSTGAKIKLTEGYRSAARQQELYNQYLRYLRTGEGDVKLAAKPGTSWHEFRLAIDTSTQPIRSMNNTELAPYGLCKPIKSEGWHIQPIETKGQSDRAKFEPIEVEKMEEEDMRYNKVTELPKGLQKEIQELVDSGALKGDEKGNLNITEDMARCLIINKRYADSKK